MNIKNNMRWLDINMEVSKKCEHLQIDNSSIETFGFWGSPILQNLQMYDHMI